MSAKKTRRKVLLGGKVPFFFESVNLDEIQKKLACVLKIFLVYLAIDKSLPRSLTISRAGAAIGAGMQFLGEALCFLKGSLGYSSLHILCFVRQRRVR